MLDAASRQRTHRRWVDHHDKFRREAEASDVLDNFLGFLVTFLEKLAKGIPWVRQFVMAPHNAPGTLLSVAFASVLTRVYQTLHPAREISAPERALCTHRVSYLTGSRVH